MTEAEFKSAFPEVGNRTNLPDMDLWKLNMQVDLQNIVLMHVPQFVRLYTMHVGIEMLKQVTSQGFSTFFEDSETVVHELDASSGCHL